MIGKEPGYEIHHKPAHMRIHHNCLDFAPAPETVMTEISDFLNIRLLEKHIIMMVENVGTRIQTFLWCGLVMSPHICVL